MTRRPDGLYLTRPSRPRLQADALAAGSPWVVRPLDHTMKTNLILTMSLAVLPFLSAVSQVPPPQISVTGSAEVKVAPDEIHLSVGVETRHVVAIPTSRGPGRLGR